MSLTYASNTNWGGAGSGYPPDDCNCCCCRSLFCLPLTLWKDCKESRKCKSQKKDPKIRQEVLEFLKAHNKTDSDNRINNLLDKWRNAKINPEVRISVFCDICEQHLSSKTPWVCPASTHMRVGQCIAARAERKLSCQSERQTWWSDQGWGRDFVSFRMIST